MKPIALAAAAAVLILGACSKDDPELDASAAGGAGAGIGASGIQSGQLPPNSVAFFEQVIGDRVLFATDRFDLDQSAQATLAAQAQWLASNPAVTATIEGHADERGTREYNLALGARRADAAKNFLVGQGVAASRLRVVSFGKERPVAVGSNPQAWSQNRRAVTVVAGAPTS